MEIEYLFFKILLSSHDISTLKLNLATLCLGPFVIVFFSHFLGFFDENKWLFWHFFVYFGHIVPWWLTASFNEVIIWKLWLVIRFFDYYGHISRAWLGLDTNKVYDVMRFLYQIAYTLIVDAVALGSIYAVLMITFITKTFFSPLH